jgi:hypothetical protein
MKKIALISTYCDNQKKIDVLIDNIRILKELGLDVLIISPVLLPNEVILECDYSFFTKENPVLVWPQRAFTFWKTVYYKGNFVMMHRNVSDYGWAALNQIKRLSEIALSYDYDIFYHLIYDLDIDNVIINEIKTNQVNFIHPRINPRVDPNNKDEFWEATLHFMSFDREMMNKVLDLITYENYTNGNGFAEGQALTWTKVLPIEIKSEPVKDKIYYWENYDFFNYSKDENYKLFISKHDECEIIKNGSQITETQDSKLRLFFYDVKEPKTVKILCDENDYEFFVDSNFYVTLNNDSTKVKKLIINDQDFSEVFNNIDRNITYID